MNRLIFLTCILATFVISQNVVSWGKNWYGELGTGTRVTVQIGNGFSPLAVKTDNFTANPYQNTSMPHALLVAAGNDHSLLYADDGNLYAFGNNQFGQLGAGTGGNNQKSATPLRVLFNKTDTEKVIMIAASWSDFCVIVTEEKATGNHFIYSWGHHFNGFLGTGSVGAYGRIQPVPTDVKMNNLQKEFVKTLMTGDGHTLLLTVSGKLFSWGDNTNGQLGDGGTQVKYEPTAVSLGALLGREIASVHTHGGNHNFIITVDGMLYGWGKNNLGQLGDLPSGNNLLPALVGGNLKGKVVEMVAPGLEHSVVMTSEKLIYGFGSNQFGQSGNKSTDSPMNDGPQLAVALNELMKKESDLPKRILCGDSTTFIWGISGRLYAIGMNNRGQLGSGSQKTHILGLAVRTDENTDLNGKEILDVAVGYQHVMAITPNSGCVMMMSIVTLVIMAVFTL